MYTMTDDVPLTTTEQLVTADLWMFRRLDSRSSRHERCIDMSLRDVHPVTARFVTKQLHVNQTTRCCRSVAGGRSSSSILPYRRLRKKSTAFAMDCHLPTLFPSRHCIRAVPQQLWNQLHALTGPRRHSTSAPQSCSRR
jgi:hypothetical protein